MDIDELKLDATEPKYDPVTGRISFYEGGKKFEITKEALLEKKGNDIKEISRQRANRYLLEKCKKAAFYIRDKITGQKIKLDKEEQRIVLMRIEHDMENEKQHWVKVK